MEEDKWMRRARFVVPWAAFFAFLVVFCRWPSDVVTLLQALASVLAVFALLVFLIRPRQELRDIMSAFAKRGGLLKAPFDLFSLSVPGGEELVQGITEKPLGSGVEWNINAPDGEALVERIKGRPPEDEAVETSESRKPERMPPLSADAENDETMNA
jgi:hypothetical protein